MHVESMTMFSEWLTKQLWLIHNPVPDQPSLYLFTEGDSKVSEVLQCKEEFRSWFIGETVNQGILITSISYKSNLKDLHGYK